MRAALRLRKARPEEAEMLTQLALRSKRAWGYDDAFMRAIHDDMVVRGEYLERDHALVAEEGATIVAYAILHVNGEEAYLRDLFVDPPFMSSGIGSLLFDEMLAFARARAVRRLTLTSDPNAVGFYERYGMRIVGQEASTYVPGRTLPIMAMDL
jgi:ribosomal protein S18 acetylase RimI-like enzyme